MKLVWKLSALAMLLIVAAAPVMACLAPDARLTDEERECCREMAGQCDEMPSSHSCCQPTVTSEHQSFLVAQHHFQPELSLVSMLLDVDADSEGRSVLLNADIPRHPPPEPSTLQLSLRI
jgi:hypothetical protein